MVSFIWLNVIIKELSFNCENDSFSPLITVLLFILFFSVFVTFTICGVLFCFLVAIIALLYGHIIMRNKKHI